MRTWLITTTLTFLGGLVALTGARPVARARTNDAVWQAEPFYALAVTPNTLAFIQGFGFALETQPTLMWQRMGTGRRVHMAAALVGFGQRLHEMPRFGYSLRLDDVRLGWQTSSDAAAPGAEQPAAAPLLHTGYARLGAAEAEGRLYPWAQQQPYFVRASVGLNHGLSQWYKSASGQADQPVAPGATNPIQHWPVSVALGLGAGRLYPIGPRVAVSHIEALLRQAYVIRAPLPEAARQRIIALLMARASGLGADNQALGVMRAIFDAGLVTGELTADVAYRLERLLETWSVSPVMTRLHGGQAWAQVRGAYQPLLGQNSAFSLVLELRGRKALNVDLYTQLMLEPALGFAPRLQDRTANGLMAPRTQAILDARPIASLLGPERMRLDLPASVARLYVDADRNPQGLLALSVDIDLGLTDKAHVSASVGGAYTFFWTGVRGIKLGLNVAGGRTERGGEGLIEMQVAYVDGSGNAFYVAPDYPDAAVTAAGDRGLP